MGASMNQAFVSFARPTSRLVLPLPSLSKACPRITNISISFMFTLFSSTLVSKCSQMSVVTLKLQAHKTVKNCVEFDLLDLQTFHGPKSL